jgi:hypothetical protein
VIFCKDSVFSFSENIDFVKIHKSETNSISFIFNPAENNKFYIYDRWDDTQINQVNFTVEKINRGDTTFFEEYIVEGTSGTHAYKVKPPYFRISVEGFLQSVFYTNYNEIEEYSMKVEPIK